MHYKEIYDSLLKDLTNYKPHLSPLTLKVYVLNGIKLMRDIDVDYTATMFNDFEKVSHFLKGLKQTTNTIKNKINTIIVFLQMNRQPRSIIASYEKLILEFSNKLHEEHPALKKTEREEENWLSKDDIEDKIYEMEQALPDKIENYFDLFKYQQYIALNFHINVAPLRNELCDAEIMYSIDFNSKKKDPNINYIILYRKGKNVNNAKAIIQNYKTKKTYNIIEININDDETRKLSKYYKELNDFKQKQGINNSWFLINKDGSKLTRNEYTQFLQKIFKDDNKKISSSMIRKIVVSDLYNADKMQELAHNMGHSINEAVSEYVKG